ncbi:MAG: hypothetical protein J7L45_02055 [Candidatus Aenigmarchaeota archaeon]|nr:hypothetical protein [Candidatus Aenigmarchaeota archaeon]
MTNTIGYGFIVEYYEFSGRLLDRIKGSPLGIGEGDYLDNIYASKVDPDVCIIDDIGTNTAKIFTLKNDKVQKVKELEKDFVIAKKADIEIEEIKRKMNEAMEQAIEKIYEKEDIKEILEKYRI